MRVRRSYSRDAGGRVLYRDIVQLREGFNHFDVVLVGVTPTKFLSDAYRRINH